MENENEVLSAFVKYPNEPKYKMKFLRACQKVERISSNKDWSVYLDGVDISVIRRLEEINGEIKEEKNRGVIKIVGANDPFFIEACNDLIQLFGETFTNLVENELLEESGITQERIQFIKPIQERLRGAL